MKASSAIPAGLALVWACGCAYHGAVYSEYSQFALDVRTTAESSSPVKVDLGYDRGVVAYVPKLNGKDGEACSIISWQNIGSMPNPTGLSSNKLLTVDAAVISGTAANVAAVPASNTVIVAQPGAPPIQLQISGSPAQRIGAAVAALTFGQDMNTARIRAWLKKDTANRGNLRTWLDGKGLKDVGITDLLDTDKYAPTRQVAVDELHIP